MRRIAVLALSAFALALLGVGAAAAAPTRATTLTPAEQKWVKPFLEVYNVMNAGLHVILAQEGATDALVAGTAANKPLTQTLLVFAACTPKVKNSGKAPTARMAGFLTAITASCAHLGAGAHDVAKAIGAIGKANGKLARTYLAASLTEFKAGSKLLGTAGADLRLVGGKNIFTA